MKKKPEVFFEDRGGAGPLALYWFEGPYGDAVEADAGKGIGFFDEAGRLLAVQFDHVHAAKDHQVLGFGKNLVEVFVSRGRVVTANRNPSDPGSNPTKINDPIAGRARRRRRVA